MASVRCGVGGICCCNNITIMLSRHIARSLTFLLRPKQSFSGGHDHHHHDYSVQVDKVGTWVKYKSDPRLVSLEGIEETNYPLQPLDDSDPFEHIRNSPFFSYSRMVYNDPWYHDDSHEIYNSAPERGYINGEDPLETRFLYTLPLFATICLVGIVGTLYGFADLEVTPSEAALHNEKDARDYVFQRLAEKNKILNALRARENELINATAE